MRLYEFRPAEVNLFGDKDQVRVMIVDLDAIVLLKKTQSQISSDIFSWLVSFSSGDYVFVTELGFERILLAWKAE
ncbi:MAG: hypothetical protein HYZ50_11500 [Deltaproteobacteria bacterium]|nr:hypothetical protein [Deltaproteobacteria bacterium]